MSGEPVGLPSDKDELRGNMKKHFIMVIAAMVVILGLVASGHAGSPPMQSENFAVTSSVISGGGAPMESVTYRTNSTFGQPSPLLEVLYPVSASYDLYPGFWYTPGGESAVCDMASFADCFGSVDGDGNYDEACDFDDDLDVDGTDLAVFF